MVQLCVFINQTPLPAVPQQTIKGMHHPTIRTLADLCSAFTIRQTSKDLPPSCMAHSKQPPPPSVLLIQVGFKRFHILTHSMGARTWFSVYEAAKHLFLDVDAREYHSGGQPRAHLVSVTLMNSEYPVRDFVGTGYHSLREKCNHITIYGNKKDGALMWAQIFNDPQNFGAEKSLGKAMDDPSLSSGQLDVDVIDTTLLANNVHKTKHSYFNINRELVEDLRDLIVTQRRAKHRIRLRRVKRGTNVFVFMVAPPALNNG